MAEALSEPPHSEPAHSEPAHTEPDAELTSRWPLAGPPAAPLDLARTVSVLRHGGGDPTTALLGGVFWRACRTPDGPGRLAVHRQDGWLVGRAWGDGGGWLLDSVPGLVGLADDWTGLELYGQPVLTQVRRQFPGLRLCRTGLVLDSLVPAILEQRVTGAEAWRAWRSLVLAYGQAAPGPDHPAQRIAPSASALLRVTSWDWHRFGVDGQRQRAVRAAATVAGRLEECVAMADAGDFAAAHARLRVVPGLGEWTAAEVALRALGDRDAVSVGDFHLKNRVGFALTGAARTDDETMLSLLEPWRGQRARVVRLIELSGLTPPKYGPRYAPQDMRRF